MCKTKASQLLETWRQVLLFGEKISYAKALKNSDGLGVDGRIRRTKGSPITFDMKTYSCQKQIQQELCQELPMYKKLINSTPEIMDGYRWTRKDFIELYFSHYLLVVEKLTKLIGTTSTV